MKNIIFAFTLSMGFAFYPGFAIASEQSQDLKLYFSINGLVANQYIDGGINKLSQNRKHGEPISDSSLLFKNGYWFRRFEREGETIKGKIDKFVYIADGNAYVFFNVDNPNGNYMGNKGLYVIAENDVDLEIVEKIDTALNKDSFEALKKNIILYFENNEKQLWQLLRFVRFDRPGIGKLQALDMLRDEFVFSKNSMKISSSSTIEVIEAKEKVRRNGYHLTAFVFPDGKLEVMVQTSFILGIKVKNIPHFLVHRSYAGTGEHGYILYEMKNQEFISRFEEWSFST